jgi:hypothetical protein
MIVIRSLGSDDLIGRWRDFLQISRGIYFPSNTMVEIDILIFW